jgi:hypothetical protein
VKMLEVKSQIVGLVGDVQVDILADYLNTMESPPGLFDS